MDRELSEVIPSDNPQLRIARLRAEHQQLESRLDELNALVYLTPDEQFERKRIQKLKLQKKDMLHRLSKPASA